MQDTGEKTKYIFLVIKSQYHSLYVCYLTSLRFPLYMILHMVSEAEHFISLSCSLSFFYSFVPDLLRRCPNHRRTCLLSDSALVTCPENF